MLSSFLLSWSHLLIYILLTSLAPLPSFPFVMLYFACQNAPSSLRLFVFRLFAGLCACHVRRAVWARADKIDSIARIANRKFCISKCSILGVSYYSWRNFVTFCRVIRGWTKRPSNSHSSWFCAAHGSGRCTKDQTRNRLSVTDSSDELTWRIERLSRSLHSQPCTRHFCAIEKV